MKRVVLIVLGVIVLIVTVPFLIGGVAFTAIGSGDDPTVGGRLGQVESSGYAVVSDTLEVHWDYPFADRFDITLGVRNARSGAPVFIGYGPASAVDSYLSGVPHTLVHDLGRGNRPERDVDIPGNAVPQAPVEQDFWLEQASGTGLQEIPLASPSGDYRLVVMNAAGSRGLVVDVHGSLTLPFLLPVGIGMLVIGLMLLALGVALLVWGIRSRPAPSAAPASAPAPHPYAPPPASSYHPGSGPYGPPGQYPGVAPGGPPPGAPPGGPAPGGPAPGGPPPGGPAPGGPPPGGPPAPPPPPPGSGATGP